VLVGELAGDLTGASLLALAGLLLQAFVGHEKPRVAEPRDDAKAIGVVDVVLAFFLLSLPPQPVSASASAAARRAAADLAALRVRFLLLVLRITAPFCDLRRTSSAVPCDLVYARGVGSASARPLSTGGS